MPRTMDEYIQDQKSKRRFMKRRLSGYFQRSKQKVIDTINWVKDHPKDIAILASAATGVTTAIRRGLRFMERGKERYDKRRRIYDHSTDTFRRLRKPISEMDAKKIDAYRKSHPGCTRIEALRRFDLLK